MPLTNARSLAASQVRDCDSHQALDMRHLPARSPKPFSVLPDHARKRENGTATRFAPVREPDGKLISYYLGRWSCDKDPRECPVTCQCSDMTQTLRASQPHQCDARAHMSTCPRDGGCDTRIDHAHPLIAAMDLALPAHERVCCLPARFEGTQPWSEGPKTVQKKASQ